MKSKYEYFGIASSIQGICFNKNKEIIQNNTRKIFDQTMIISKIDINKKNSEIQSNISQKDEAKETNRILKASYDNYNSQKSNLEKLQSIIVNKNFNAKSKYETVKKNQTQTNDSNQERIFNNLDAVRTDLRKNYLR